VILRRFAPSSADVDEFFATHIERHNFAITAPRLRVLPVYAVIGGRDKLVSGFSATFGVPKEQRLYLEAGHSSMHKDDQLIGWLQRSIADRLEVRAQATREQQHAADHVAATVAPRPSIVTKFVSDSSGLLWEELYNEVRRDATTTAMAIQDERETQGADIDLLIAVHDAQGPGVL
jgi:hypothetical protein